MGFNFTGHCGYADNGKDIVCAAVSSAIYLIINTVTEIINITPKELKIDKGDIVFTIHENDEPQCRILFNGLKAHLFGLEEIYPQNIRVDYMEV